MLNKLIAALTKLNSESYAGNPVEDLITFIEDDAEYFAQVLLTSVDEHPKWQAEEELECEDCGELESECSCEECNDCGTTPCICE